MAFCHLSSFLPDGIFSSSANGKPKAPAGLSSEWPAQFEDGEMADSKHTPGPWEWLADEDRHEADCVPVMAKDGTLQIADIFAGTVNGSDMSVDEAEANARLIAAAPDLLEALEQLAAYGDPEMDATVQLPWEDVAKARAAIAKAEARS